MLVFSDWLKSSLKKIQYYASGFLKGTYLQDPFSKTHLFAKQCNSPLESDLLSSFSRLLPQHVISNYLDLLTLSVSVLIQIRKHWQSNSPKVQCLGPAAWNTISQELTHSQKEILPEEILKEGKEAGKQVAQEDL